MSTPESPLQNRRTFLKVSGVATVGTASLAGLSSSAQAATASRGLARNSVILFQGDSITDASRSREAQASETPNNQAGLGAGYAWLAAVDLLVARPLDNLQVFNRGISGNKVFQLADRWKTDCLELKPDVVSILVGVNDIWHTFSLGYDGTVEKYENDYLALLEQTKKMLPSVKLIVCEPFVLRCGAVTDKWFPEFDNYRAAAKRVAQKHGAVFVAFQSMFDEAIKYAPPAYWAADGVHPTASGAALMAHYWLRTVSAAD